MSMIPLKRRSNSYEGEHPYSSLWTDHSLGPPIPGSTPSLTTPTATHHPPTELSLNWPPTTLRLGHPHFTRIDVEAPGSSASHKTYFFLVFLVVVVLVGCWLLYKHIPDIQNSERHPAREGLLPGVSPLALQENRQQHLGSREGIRGGPMSRAPRDAGERIGRRRRGQRGRRGRRGRRGIDISEEVEDEVPRGPGGLSPIAEVSEGFSSDNPSDADDEGGSDS